MHKSRYRCVWNRPISVSHFEIHVYRTISTTFVSRFMHANMDTDFTFWLIFLNTVLFCTPCLYWLRVDVWQETFFSVLLYWWVIDVCTQMNKDVVFTWYNWWWNLSSLIWTELDRPNLNYWLQQMDSRNFDCPIQNSGQSTHMFYHYFRLWIFVRSFILFLQLTTNILCPHLWTGRFHVFYYLQ